jgi:HD-like signal output (HDOD) protein
MVLMWNAEADLRDFLAVIEGDPGLTASVLRAANSAQSAPVDPVTTARNAVVRIGLETTRQITVAALTRAQFETLEDSGIDVDHFWRWLLTKTFATHDGLPADERQVAFTAGLLHQIGRLAYASRSPRRYLEVVGLVERGRPLIEAETEVFGASGPSVNSEIAFQWSLPDPLVAAIITPEDRPVSPLGALVAEASAVATDLGVVDGVGPVDFVDPVSLDDDHPRRATIEALGGIDGIDEQVSWFRHATGPRAAGTDEIRTASD